MTVVRSFVTWFAVAPIFVRLFGDVKSPIVFHVGATAHAVNISLPFSWWILWAASFLYVCAYVLFSYFCPPFIKRYQSYSDYQAIGHSPRYLAHQLSRAFQSTSDKAQLIRRLRIKSFSKPTNCVLPPEQNPSVEEDGTKFFFSHDGQSLEVTVTSNETDTQQRELFWEIFEPFANSYLNVRIVIRILLVVSFSLVVTVTAQQIYSVLRYAYNAL